MELTVKLLQQNNENFVPLTVSEAVLVKHEDSVKTLAKVLQVKLEKATTDNDDSLTVSTTDTTLTVSHKQRFAEKEDLESNILTSPASTKLTPVLLKHDNFGHIVETEPVKKLIVKIQNVEYINHDGSEENSVNFGDDFTTTDNKITLNWNNLN